jgi:hypothetical protein
MDSENSIPEDFPNVAKASAQEFLKKATDNIKIIKTELEWSDQVAMASQMDALVATLSSFCLTKKLNKEEKQQYILNIANLLALKIEAQPIENHLEYLQCVGTA